MSNKSRSAYFAFPSISHADAINMIQLQKSWTDILSRGHVDKYSAEFNEDFDNAQKIQHNFDHETNMLEYQCMINPKFFSPGYIGLM